MLRTLAAATVVAFLLDSASIAQVELEPSPAETYAGSPVETAPAKQAGPVNQEALKWTGREWRTNVSSKLRDQATAEGSEKHAHSTELVAIYNALQKVELSARDQRVLETKLVNRLLRARQEIVDGRDAEQPQPANVAAKPGADALEQQGVLAQVGNFAAQQLGGGGFGPAVNNQRDDEGDELVELIERTINPDSWDRNGGNGTIVYWGNLKVLVVRNTRDVHAQLQDLGDALRKAGN